MNIDSSSHGSTAHYLAKLWQRLPGKSVTHQQAIKILQQFNNLYELLHCPAKEFAKITKLGTEHQERLHAAHVLYQHSLEEQLVCGVSLANGTLVKRYLQQQLSPYRHEVFACLFLNQALRFLQFAVLFHGTINYTTVHPRLILQRCLQANAANVILCHNHPSQDLKPSQADLEITDHLRTALNFIDVNLIDHVIVSSHGALSLLEAGYLAT